MFGTYYFLENVAIMSNILKQVFNANFTSNIIIFMQIKHDSHHVSVSCSVLHLVPA